MIYKEMQGCLDEGKIVKSEQCLYIECEGSIYWKWLGENEWTEGGDTLESCINESEKSEHWKVLFDCCLPNY